MHFVKVRLRGTRSNREGLGAYVTLVLPDGRRILKVMDGKSGYLSQSDLPLYFGLGTADHAVSLEVRVTNWRAGCAACSENSFRQARRPARWEQEWTITPAIGRTTRNV